MIFYTIDIAFRALLLSLLWRPNPSSRPPCFPALPSSLTFKSSQTLISFLSETLNPTNPPSYSAAGPQTPKRSNSLQPPMEPELLHPLEATSSSSANSPWLQRRTRRRRRRWRSRRRSSSLLQLLLATAVGPPCRPPKSTPPATSIPRHTNWYSSLLLLFHWWTQMVTPSSWIWCKIEIGNDLLDLSS